MLGLDAIRRAIDPQAPPTGDVRCPVHDDSRASLSVSLSEAGNLLCHCHAGCDQRAVWDEVRRRAGHLLNGHAHAAKVQSRKTVYTYTDRGERVAVRAGKHQKAPQAPQRFEVLSEHGRELWRACEPVSGPARAYLEARGCVIPPADGDLRWHPDLRHPVTGYAGPALVALVTHAESRAPMTLHRTWISADGTKPAAADPARLLLGRHSKRFGVIRLFPDECVTYGLLVGEGIESVLAAARDFTPAWAAIDAGGLETLPVLRGIETLIVGADHDEHGRGEAAALACARRWRAAGAEVHVLAPRAAGTDWCDVARAAA